MEITTGLTSNKTLEEVLKLYNMCFNLNSLADRASYVLSISMSYKDLGEFVHKIIAHGSIGDNLADRIEAYGEIRNDLFFRGVVPEHKEEYNAVNKVFETLTIEVSNIQKQCVKAIHVAEKEGDEGFEDELREINRGYISSLLKQCILLYNGSKKYDNFGAGYKFNKDFYSYLIEPFKSDFIGKEED